MSESDTRFLFADVICSEIDPQKYQTSDEQCKTNDVLHVAGGSRHKIGGFYLEFASWTENRGLLAFMDWF